MLLLWTWITKGMKGLQNPKETIKTHLLKVTPSGIQLAWMCKKHVGSRTLESASRHTTRLSTTLHAECVLGWQESRAWKQNTSGECTCSHLIIVRNRDSLLLHDGCHSPCFGHFCCLRLQVFTFLSSTVCLQLVDTTWLEKLLMLLVWCASCTSVAAYQLLHQQVVHACMGMWFVDTHQHGRSGL